MIELNNQIKYATYEIDTFISHNGISEYQVIIHATPGKTFNDQLNEITDTYNQLKEKLRKNITPVFKRYFLSYASNQ